MRSVSVVLAGGLVLTGCSSMPSVDVFSSAPPTATVQIESEPPGAEARTSGGQTCRTPCALAVPMADFTVSYSLAGYQPQTVQVRFSAPDPRVDSSLGTAPPPVIDPNPVYAELEPAPPPRRQRQPRRSRPTAAAPAQQAAQPSIAAPEPMPAAAPAPAPASPWPPVPR